MPADEEAQAFANARGALRDNAKWVLAGTGALLALVVGGATISQLGSLYPVGPNAWRFWLAVGAGLLALRQCAVPVDRAIRLLRIDVVTMKTFLDDPEPDAAQALSTIEGKLADKFPGGRLRNYLNEFERQRELSQARTAGAGEQQDAVDLEIEAAAATVEVMRKRIAEVDQMLRTELVNVQYQALMADLRGPGAWALVLFIVFAWAANPPKEGDKLLSQPRVTTVAMDVDSFLSVRPAFGVDKAACAWPTARVIVYAEESNGAQAGVMVSPKPGLDCPPVRVHMIEGKPRLAQWAIP